MSYPTWDRSYAEGMTGLFKSRALRQQVYTSNCEVFHAGGYTTESGKDVSLPVDDPMLAGTKFYSEAFSVNDIEVKTDKVLTNTVNRDCIIVAKEMQDEGYNPAVLNLADAYAACGHYKQGWRAQEESLCRATTLSRSLYQYYKATSGKADRYAQEVNVTLIKSAYPMDINFGGVYSPGVTVFRNSADDYAFLEEPYKIGIISVAALSFKEKTGKDLQYQNPEGGFTPEGLAIMKNKIRTIYRIALANGHDSLVAGAFGCGAFRLPGTDVANLFNEILNETEFKNKFRKVTFAILAKKKSDERFQPFYDLFNQ
jgi:uncharacterized protein (TIGR02452 family)